MKYFNWLIRTGLRGNYNFSKLIWLNSSDRETNEFYPILSVWELQIQYPTINCRATMAQAGIKKCQIGALKPGNNDFIVVALVINKPDPRKVVMRKDGGERWVSVFTLRDSPSDMINLTVWSSGEEAARLKEEFKVGMVVEVVKPKVLSRDVSGGRDFNPQVTSPFQLSFQEGRSTLCPHLADVPSLTQLLNVPSKASSTFLSINDIVTNSGALKGHYVDMLGAVRKVGEVSRFTRKQDGQEGGVRRVRLFDQTADSL